MTNQELPTPETSVFGAAENATLAVLADSLIPRSGEHPSASDVGVPGHLLDRAVRVVPGATERVQDVAVRFAGTTTPESDLESLRVEEPAAFDLFAELVAGAYFMSDDVRRIIGYPGQPQVAARTDLEDFVDLVMPVLEAGHAPRATEVSARD